MQNGYVFIGSFATSISMILFIPTSLPLFLRKLQGKHQSEPQEKQAQHALSLFYEMQTAPVRSPVTTEPPSHLFLS